MFEGMSREHLALLCTGVAGLCYLLAIDRVRPAWRIYCAVALWLMAILCFVSGGLLVGGDW